MATPLLVSFDPSSPTSGLSLEQISYFGRVLIKASSLPQASEFISKNFPVLDIYVDVTEIASVGDIVDILNAGAAKAFVSLEQLKALSQEQNVPSSRLVVYAPSGQEVQFVKSWIAENEERKEIGVSTNPAEVQTVAQTLGIDLEAQRLYASFVGKSVAEESVKSSLEQGAVNIVPSQALTFEKNAGDKIPAGKLVAARAVADQHTGLYATTVTDERGILLGFVWSSDESIAEALRTGTGVYQSRKRGLWYKGQSSGDTQELVRIGFDCDSDCLIFVVKQQGRGM